MRQRVLSEAALRMDEPGRRPLVVVFPHVERRRGPRLLPVLRRARRELDAPRFAGRRHRAAARRWPPDRFSYPQWQVNHEVDDAAFASFAELTEQAKHLQGVISVENDLTARIRADSLGNLSYAARENAMRARVATVSTTGWVRAAARLNLGVAVPRRVILSSNSGPFSVTITNGLDVPVSVRIKATSSPPMDITVPDRIDLDGGSTTTRLLEASTDKLGVHNVTISVTDLDGNPLGASVELPIRAAQVSQVIWLIMGGAVGLLFLAIVLRLVRRIRGTGSAGSNTWLCLAAFGSVASCSAPGWPARSTAVRHAGTLVSELGGVPVA